MGWISELTSSSGFKWLETEEGCWDTTAELLWLPPESGKYTYEEALKLETEDKRLPSIDEFFTACEHGASEESIGVLTEHYYWSGSLAGTVDQSCRNAYIFSSPARLKIPQFIRGHATSVQMVRRT